ncbi:Glu aminopeptidase [Salpingoeca rosetta]|uniref:Aminopeptidase n=1 Tax=Salpingoeca rosetta (strain ATCC 50818 / BSB-021) TaxID=946362 RepID=F2UHM9_SALR5|nr:Glu aminopeptidase [Salpingoeca rosetta]EGD76628.1 Glu aminopeptidase [Salpingoeca rosetta]|eukprot:XP_004991542.1 Glu aminopeptidase [Salpingoeca rosetta]
MARDAAYQDERAWITAEDAARRHEKTKCCTLWYWKNLDRMNYVYLIAFTTLIAIILAGALTAHKRSSRPAWDVDRLPTTVKPMTYNITLTPSIEHLNVSGAVDITVNVTAMSKFIVLHAFEMDITGYSVLDLSNNGVVDIKELTTANELLALHPTSPIVPGLYSLHFDFTYNVTGDLAGLYKSTYTTAAGQNRTILTTQMEALDARKAFPCFDEPGFKAEFTIATYKPAGYIALSNMPPAVDVPQAQAGVVHFQSTPRMSTYLVALVICDFVSIADTTTSNVPIRVFAPADQIQDAPFSLSVATRVLEYYESVFGIPYALPKLDLIAIPDFAAGAMENWGLVTYRETALLYNGTQSAASDQQWVALVVAHELAHQWFGNLVTMEWWNDLWLNEGFATFMETAGVAHLFPDWEMWHQFPADTREVARAADSVTGTHALHSPADEVISRNDIDARFDTISYEKGGSVLRMLEQVIGSTELFGALQLYMNTYKYSNAVSEQLWQSIDISIKALLYNGTQSAASDQQWVALVVAHELYVEVEAGWRFVAGCSVDLPYNVTQFMTSWSSKAGYPIVSVQPATNTSVAVSQHRFTAPSVSAPDTTWIVPLTVTPLSRRSINTCARAYHWPPTADAQQYHVNLTAACMLGGSGDALLANVGGDGYYRVNYTQDNWAALTRAVLDGSASSPLTDLDATTLLNDAFAMHFFNLIDYSVPLELLDAARNSSRHHYSVVIAMISAVNHIGRLMESDAELAALNAYAANLLPSVLANLTTDNIAQRQDHVSALLQGDVLHFACRAGNPIRSTVSQLFDAFVATGTAPHADILDAVLSEGVRSARPGATDAVWNLYETTTVAAVKDTCLAALASSTDPDQLNALIAEAFSSGGRIREQDRDVVLRVIGRRSRVGANTVWQFVKNNIDEIPSLPRVLGVIASRMSTEEEANDLKRTLDANKDAVDSLSKQVLVEQVRVQSNWRKHNAQGVLAWLTSHM